MVPLRLEQFFGCHPEDLPMPQFTYPFLEEILQAGFGPFADGPCARDLTVINFFKLIDAVSHSATEATVDQLALVIMTHLGYQLLGPDGEVSDLSPQHQLYFEMDGVQTGARVDIALVDRIRALLCLFVEDKRLLRSETGQAALKWPHAQVVAHALGAYNANMNEAREKARVAVGIRQEDVDALAHDYFDMVCHILLFAQDPNRLVPQVIPLFTLIGSLPCFYLVPITAAFASAVARGEFPPHPTKVFYCVAPVEWEFYGMLVKNQRLLILKMFEGFKRFIPTNFAQLCLFSRLGGTVPKPLNPTFHTNAWNWVHRFLWESEEHCRSRGIDKAGYASGSINYFVGSSAVFSTPNHNPSSPQPPKAPEGYPSGFQGFQ
jgi:hypothetical protein